MENAIIFFDGPMVKDVSLQSMLPGHKINSRNMRYNDEIGAAQEIIGNSEVVNAGLPAGTNVCVHAHSQFDKKFYFIHNSNSDHQIWEYNTNTEAFRLILEDSLLNFQIGQIIQARNIGDMLYWTDGWFFKFLKNTGTGLNSYNPPRKINIEKGVLYQSSGGSNASGYSIVDFETLDMIKYPPPFKPMTEYQTDLNRSTNELYRKLIQFTYRYVYDDNEVSVWSQYSKVILPSSQEGIDGRRYSVPELDNYIRLTIQTGHEIVDKIQIAARVGTYGNFGIFKTIDKEVEGIADNTVHYVDFYGDESVEIIDNQDLRTYDTLPQISDLIESVNGNTVVLGNIYEGYDNVDIEATIEHTFRKVNSESSFALEMVLEREWRCFTSDGGAFTPWEYSSDFMQSYIILDPNNLPPIDTVIEIKHRNFYGGQITNYSYFYSSVAGDDTSVDTFGANLYAFLQPLVINNIFLVTVGDGNAAFFGVDESIISPNGYKYIRFQSQYETYLDDYNFVGPNVPDPVDGVGVSFDPPGLNNSYQYYRDADNLTSSQNSVSRCWKWGSHHPIGIVYTDRAKRDGTVMTSDSMREYVPFPTEVDLPSEGVLNNTPYINPLKFSITHRPPEWATQYHFVYQGNSRILSFQHRTVIKIETHNENRIKISLDNIYQERYVGANISHQIKVGDVVRLLTSYPDPFDIYPIPFLEEYIELSVLEYFADQGEDGSESVVVEMFDFEEILGGDEGLVIEIYTPKDSTEEALWFELGEDFKISSPHTSTRSHQGGGFKNSEVISIDVSASEIVVVGDHGYMDLNGTITVSDSPNGNDGDYIVTSSVYDIDANETTIIINTSFPGTDDVVDTGVLCSGRQDQNSSLTAAAQGYLDDGDCFYRIRPMATGFTSAADSIIPFIQDFHLSDYYVSDWYNKGKVRIFDVNNRRIHRTGLMRNSQKYLDNTLINGLSTFYGLDQAQVQDNFGPLYGIAQVGQTLKYFQEDKVGSVYINQDEITNADGSKQLITTNKVLGTIRPHEEPYGCSDTLSIVKVDRDIFFYDREKSVMVKATPGGLVPVSDIGMRTWFRDKKDDFVSDTRVLCVHDRRNSEVIIVWSSPSEALSYNGRNALGFNYKKDHFTSFYDVGVEMLIGVSDDRLFSFKEGVLYKHDDGNIREFYGEDVEGEITWVFNQHPNELKIMKGMKMNSNKAILFEEVDIPTSPKYPNGMTSRITEGSFREEEGALYANYRRDQNDPRFTSEAVARVNGREMQGYLVVHKMLLADSTTTRLNLKNITLFYERSKTT